MTVLAFFEELQNIHFGIHVNRSPIAHKADLVHQSAGAHWCHYFKHREPVSNSVDMPHAIQTCKYNISIVSHASMTLLPVTCPALRMNHRHNKLHAKLNVKQSHIPAAVASATCKPTHRINRLPDHTDQSMPDILPLQISTVHLLLDILLICVIAQPFLAAYRAPFHDCANTGCCISLHRHCFPN